MSQQPPPPPPGQPYQQQPPTYYPPPWPQQPRGQTPSQWRNTSQSSPQWGQYPPQSQPPPQRNYQQPRQYQPSQQSSQQRPMYPGQFQPPPYTQPQFYTSQPRSQSPLPPPLQTAARSGQRSLLMLSCISVFLFVVFGIGYLYWPQMNTFLISFEPSCTVGIIGTSATVTIQGWQATQRCDNLFNGQQAPNAPKIDTSKIYRLDSPPDAPVVCQFDRNGLRVTIRDGGLIKLFGNALCQAILSPPASS